MSFDAPRYGTHKTDPQRMAGLVKDKIDMESLERRLVADYRNTSINWSPPPGSYRELPGGLKVAPPLFNLAKAIQDKCPTAYFLPIAQQYTVYQGVRLSEYADFGGVVWCGHNMLTTLLLCDTRSVCPVMPIFVGAIYSDRPVTYVIGGYDLPARARSYPQRLRLISGDKHVYASRRLPDALKRVENTYTLISKGTARDAFVENAIEKDMHSGSVIHPQGASMWGLRNSKDTWLNRFGAANLCHIYAKHPEVFPHHTVSIMEQLSKITKEWLALEGWKTTKDRVSIINMLGEVVVTRVDAELRQCGMPQMYSDVGALPERLLASIATLQMVPENQVIPDVGWRVDGTSYVVLVDKDELL